MFDNSKNNNRSIYTTKTLSRKWRAKRICILKWRAYRVCPTMWYRTSSDRFRGPFNQFANVNVHRHTPTLRTKPQARFSQYIWGNSFDSCEFNSINSTSGSTRVTTHNRFEPVNKAPQQSRANALHHSATSHFEGVLIWNATPAVLLLHVYECAVASIAKHRMVA